MPIIGSFGAGSGKGFGFSSGGPSFICATGGTITESGDYRIHTFTGPGTFQIKSAPTPENNIVGYMVVAGGGASSPNIAAGSGAGGFREGTTAPVVPYTASPLVAPAGLPVSITSYPITVGAGAANAPGYPEISPNGSNSVFSTITSAGGGKGGCASCNPSPRGAGAPGGSGGGAGGNTPGPVGSGNTPPTSPPQGNPGGTAGNDFPNLGSGGGGGATAAGGGGSPGAGGTGGAGATTSISGSPTAYAGGGGGGTYTGSGGGTGGTGGGASGGAAGPDRNGTANTGGGAAGNAGSGGSGIVIIRYKYK